MTDTDTTPLLHRLPPFIPADDDPRLADHAYRDGYQAGWAAYHDHRHRADTLAHAYLTHPRLVTAWASAAVATLDDPIPPPPDTYTGSGLLPGTPDPAPGLDLRYHLGWEYAHHNGLDDLLDALTAGDTDTIRTHLDRPVSTDEQRGVDQRPSAAYGIHAAHAQLSADPALLRAEQVAQLGGLTDPHAPGHLEARRTVLAVAGAARYAHVLTGLYVLIRRPADGHADDERTRAHTPPSDWWTTRHPFEYPGHALDAVHRLITPLLTGNR